LYKTVVVDMLGNIVNRCLSPYIVSDKAMKNIFNDKTLKFIWKPAKPQKFPAKFF